MEKCKVEGNVSSNDGISHGLASSTGENKTNVHNRRDAEVSTVSSERVNAHQASVKSDLSSDTGKPFNGKRKDLDYSVMAEASRGYHTTKRAFHNKLLKTDSTSSKESGEVFQLSSVDSTDPIPCQSSNEDLVERKPCLIQLHESKIVFRERESSVTVKSESKAAAFQSSHHCNFDLNEGIEGHPAEFQKIPPISVVAKIGVPMGLPKKPLQFGGKLGLKRSGSISAFCPHTYFKNPERGNRSCSNRGIDLNVAATLDSDFFAEESSMNFTSKQPERFLLDLNCQSENDENHHKPGAPSFDLNDNLMMEDTRKNTHHNRHSENQQLVRKSGAADTVTRFGGNVNQPEFEMRRPSYWVDLSCMRGVTHVQPHPYLVAGPAAEQVQMVVPSGLYFGKVNNLSPTFYPPSVLPHLNNQHGSVPIPQISGSVLAAYPGAVQFLEGPQGMHPHSLTNMRPTFFPNGSIPFMENGSRGVSNTELLIPVRNGLFEARERAVEQASQINYRQMASWN
ncbi:hypothetical protein SOVF_090450 [Spinacia oleracea]|uniref:Uncharacterized protein LOC110787610 n=1 Tax=Spinacia oleracea TaxID=3562 RepID=A0A9R0IEM0_SPIOL|nr:uncharacterized protein LOC110787610 [Spinacia oleracea]XP_056693384.1 uncharacterized protein LOC110787610 [Spinacia oleracea]XP_056693385.1 uncharacterized protein LOC110787610 [Spinacia oleracea]KNA16298.1 hypothetical protein SOVF_090450 [Spinacia oleracea]